MKNKTNTVNVLWTGGYDSSFRMIELSKKKVVIQPYYLSDNRKSEKHELNAIAEITKDIKNNLETRSTLLPLIIHKVSDVKADKEITQSYENLRTIIPIGTQYDWLARFAKEKEIQGLELTIEKSTTNVIRNCINKLGEIKLINNDEFAYYIIDKEKSSSDLYKVLSLFHFPTPLYHMTKTDMLTEYKTLGFEESIKKTWFCHTPINDRPCGYCNPCKSTLEEGMEFRFPESSLRRYKFQKVYKIKSLISRLLRNIRIIK